MIELSKSISNSISEKNDSTNLLFKNQMSPKLPPLNSDGGKVLLLIV